MSQTQSRLRVNPVACGGIGMCAHVAPELISLDRWGYPILDSTTTPTDPRSATAATAAVAACPRRALELT